MTYRGRMHNGVIVLEGSRRPTEGTAVRVEEDRPESEVGNKLDALAGKGKGLARDQARRHDAYRRNRR